MEGLLYVYSLSLLYMLLLLSCAGVFKAVSPWMSAQQYSVTRFLPVKVSFPREIQDSTELLYFDLLN